jgi:FMN phosphatase YigB (HAD superfamily)
MDMDGTLFDAKKKTKANRISLKMLHNYLNETGILQRMEKEEIIRINKDVMNDHVTTTIRSISNRYGIGIKEIGSLAYDILPEDVGINRDERLVRQLSAISKSYKLAVFSNGYEIWVKRVIRSLGLGSIIRKSMIVSPPNMGKYVKPEPGSFAMMLKKTRLRRSDILFLDDKMQNVSMARKIGIRSMLVDNSGSNKINSIYSILDRIALGKVK